MAQPNTLSEMVAQGRNLFIGCIGCKRSVYIEGPKAVEMFGGNRTIQGVRDVAKCSRCGSTRYGLNVDTAKPPKSGSDLTAIR